MTQADSAGVPWEGRSFSENSFQNDDGTENPEVTASLTKFRDSEISFAELLQSFQNSRVLIPLVPKAEGTKMGQHGQIVDTSSEMHIVSLSGPDGLPALPVFSSASKVQMWNTDARPVPTQFEKALLAAAAEGQTRVVMNPGDEDWFCIRRPAIESLAQQATWVEPEKNPAVKSLVSKAIRDLPVVGFRLETGDPTRKLISEELVVLLKLKQGLDKTDTKQVVADFLSSLDYEKFNPLVDSLKISLVA